MAGKTLPAGVLKAVILTALLFVPALSGELGWLRAFIPLAAFFILVTSGASRGSSILINAVLAAAVGCGLLRAWQAFFFSVLFLPLAFVLARAARKRRSVLRAGTTGTIVVIVIWVAGALLYGMVEHVHPYQQILKSIDGALAATFAMYQESSHIEPDTMAQIKQAFDRMRALIPVIFPAVAVNTALFTVWLNLLLGDLLLRKKEAGVIPWQPNSEWRLPDQLVWLLIAAGSGLMLPFSWLQKFSLNCVLVIGLLYFFQGQAVLAALFNRWDVPWPFRYIVYALVLFQAYGIIFLSIAGLVDVWFDLRKSQTKTT